MAGGISSPVRACVFNGQGRKDNDLRQSGAVLWSFASARRYLVRKSQSHHFRVRFHRFADRTGSFLYECLHCQLESAGISIAVFSARYHSAQRDLESGDVAESRQDHGGGVWLFEQSYELSLRRAALEWHAANRLVLYRSDKHWIFAISRTRNVAAFPFAPARRSKGVLHMEPGPRRRKQSLECHDPLRRTGDTARRLRNLSFRH